MIIDISPDYNLFIQIFFMLWVLKGILKLACGLIQVDKVRSDKYGGLDIIYGGIVLLLASWVVF